VSSDAAEAEVIPYVPPVGSGTGPAVAEVPPVQPPLVLAELDTRFAAVFQPDYPASERRREVEGAARVRVLIGTDGRPRQGRRADQRRQPRLL
jgi:protein TonB